jgi:putative ABC transport system permease protein
MLAISRLLIGIAAAIVPSSVRQDWIREWHAELWHRHERLRGRRAFASNADLVLRASGAVVHAMWLRKEEWSLSVIMQDVRYALRGLWHRPAFAGIAIVMLALGIGVNAAVFSVVRTVLLKPLPYREPDRLVQIWETNPLRNWTQATVAPANLLDWRARSRSFEGIAYYMGSDTKAPGIADSTLTGAGEPERVRGLLVSANLFSVLGTPAAYGRTFNPEDELRGRNRVVVLSERFWQRRFARDPLVVGRRIDLNGVSFEVVGVMPRRFEVPGAEADYWAPRLYDEAQLRAMRRPHLFRAVARLAPGVTIDQARGEMTQIMSDLEREYPNTNTKMGAGLGPLHDWFVGESREALVMLMAAVVTVLLIACANVAGLLLARATTRRRELAIRVALGAGRLRLFRQLLTEGLVLACGGATLGILFAQAAIGWLRRNGPASVPRFGQIAIDGWVLVFIVGMTVVTALAFGLAPAWQSVRAAPADTLQDGARGATGGGVTLRRVLIAGEVALSVVLLVAAGLLVRSFIQLQGVDPGIQVPGGLSFRIAVPSQRYDTDAKVITFYSEALGRIRALSGVQAAGATVRLALEGYNWTGDLFIEGRPEVWGRELRHKAITPGYLAAAGIPILTGRDFGAEDTTTGQPVIIVNQTLARTYFQDVDPIGNRLAFRQPSATTLWRTIVGVAADEKQDGLSAEVKPEVYDPYTQDSSNTMSLIVRTSGEPLAVLPAVRREIASLDGSIALYNIRTLEEVLETSLAEERFAMMVLSGFAFAALLLAAVGLYGVIAFAVSARTREIGVRLALGATRSAVLRMVVWDGLRVVLVGLVAGLGAALVMRRLMEAFLFQTASADPAVLMSVAGILSLTGAIASYIPAARAARVDPAISLRND